MYLLIICFSILLCSNNNEKDTPMTYICENYVCDLPTNNLIQIKKKLEKNIVSD